MQARIHLLPTPASRLILAGLTLALGAAGLRAEKLVTIRSSASSVYLQRRGAGGTNPRQTYVMMPGQFLAGAAYDRHLQKTTFKQLADRLASDLTRQDYFPAEELARADLVLIVNWGVTIGAARDNVALEQNLDRVRELAGQYAEARVADDDARQRGDLNALLLSPTTGLRESMDYAARSAVLGVSTAGSSPESTSHLLGFTAALREEARAIIPTERYATLAAMLEEERYFVVMIAYDAPELLRSGKLRRLWTLRASIRSAGVNFPQAIDRMANVAGDFFGKEAPDVLFKSTGDREQKTRVELKELQILGTVDEPRKPARR